MNDKDARHEPQHEYNFFCDKEIQKTLLGLSEDLENGELLRASGLHTAEPAAVTPVPPPTLPLTFGANGGKVVCPTVPRTNPKFSEFGAWCFDVGAKPKKSDKTSRYQKGDVPYRDSQKLEIYNSANYRPKEINFVFKHFLDPRKYIDQYRIDHTYNFGPLSKEMNSNTSLRVGSEHLRAAQSLNRFPIKQDPNYHSAHPGVSSRHHAESNILELAHKYKIAPGVLKEAELNQNYQNSNTGPSNGQQLVISKFNQEPLPESDSFDSATPPTSPSPIGSARSHRCSGSAKSVRTNMSATQTRIPSLPPTPGSAPRQRSESPTPNPFFHGKTMRHIPSNGYAIDNQAVSPGSNRSPNIVVPANSLRTLDLLSHVATVDRQDHGMILGVGSLLRPSACLPRVPSPHTSLAPGISSSSRIFFSKLEPHNEPQEHVVDSSLLKSRQKIRVIREPHNNRSVHSELPDENPGNRVTKERYSPLSKLTKNTSLAIVHHRSDYRTPRSEGLHYSTILEQVSKKVKRQSKVYKTVMLDRYLSDVWDYDAIEEPRLETTTPATGKVMSGEGEEYDDDDDDDAAEVPPEVLCHQALSLQQHFRVLQTGHKPVPQFNAGPSRRNGSAMTLARTKAILRNAMQGRQVAQRTSANTEKRVSSAKPKNGMYPDPVGLPDKTTAGFKHLDRAATTGDMKISPEAAKKGGMMAEIDPDTWRDKIQALKKLPKPKQHPAPNKTTDSRHFVEARRSNTTSCPTKRASLKDFASQLFRYDDSTAKAARNRRGMGRFQLMHRNSDSHARPFGELPECLDTFSDFYDPAVSAEERFDKYLHEMSDNDKRRNRCRSQEPGLNMGIYGNDRVGSLPHTSSWQLYPKGHINGGGYNVLPDIHKKQDVSTMRHLQVHKNAAPGIPNIKTVVFREKPKLSNVRCSEADTSKSSSKCHNPSQRASLDAPHTVR